MVDHINTYSHHSLRHTASSVVHKTNDKGIKVPVLHKLHPKTWAQRLTVQYTSHQKVGLAILPHVLPVVIDILSISH